MRIVVIIAIILALGLGVFNAFQYEWDQPLDGNNTIALIGMIACACAIVLLLILRSSRKIAERAKAQKR